MLDLCNVETGVVADDHIGVLSNVKRVGVKRSIRVYIGTTEVCGDGAP